MFFLTKKKHKKLLKNINGDKMMEQNSRIEEYKYWRNESISKELNEEDDTVR